MKSKAVSFFLPVLIICILLFLNGSLYVRNNYYKKENRALLLQNDSIISVNIELKEIINKITNGDFKTANQKNPGKK